MEKSPKKFMFNEKINGNFYEKIRTFMTNYELFRKFMKHFGHSYLENLTQNILHIKFMREKNVDFHEKISKFIFDYVVNYVVQKIYKTLMEN